MLPSNSKAGLRILRLKKYPREQQVQPCTGRKEIKSRQLFAHRYLVISRDVEQDARAPIQWWLLHKCSAPSVWRQTIWHCTECNQVMNVALVDHHNKSTLQHCNQEKLPTTLFPCKQFQLFITNCPIYLTEVSSVKPIYTFILNYYQTSRTCLILARVSQWSKRLLWNREYNHILSPPRSTQWLCISRSKVQVKVYYSHWQSHLPPPPPHSELVLLPHPQPEEEGWL